MNLGENIQALRKSTGMTQEELAERLNVSRQAVSKWESGQSDPEIDKLLRLSELFGCTLDELVRGAAVPDAPRQSVPEQDAAVPNVPRQSAPEQGPSEYEQRAVFEQYRAMKLKFAGAISSGVFLILAGVTFVTLTGERSKSWEIFGVSTLLICIAAAVCLFIFNGIMMGEFQKRNPEIRDFFPVDEAGAYNRTFALGLSLSVALILAGVVTLIVMVEVLHMNPNLSAGVLLACITAAVTAIVYMSIKKSMYDIVEYNREAHWAEKEEKKGDDPVSAAIMLTATAIFLLLGFVWGKWHPGWVVFPIGGILCGIASTFRRSRE